MARGAGGFHFWNRKDSARYAVPGGAGRRRIPAKRFCGCKIGFARGAAVPAEGSIYARLSRDDLPVRRKFGSSIEVLEQRRKTAAGPRDAFSKTATERGIDFSRTGV